MVWCPCYPPPLSVCSVTEPEGGLASRSVHPVGEQHRQAFTAAVLSVSAMSNPRAEMGSSRAMAVMLAL
jgi:hypothetical protein